MNVLATLSTDPAMVLRFGAATHNTHRIHYDPTFAEQEGLAGPVVMAQLHGCLFFRAAHRYAAGNYDVTSLGWDNRAPALCGDTLRITATAAQETDDGLRLELQEHNQDGVVCATGWAVLTPISPGTEENHDGL
jgi:hydroxyacyl-ACP dehydratase HTD2-like protein with hotdog domain